MTVDILGIGHCCQDSICIVEHYPPEDGSTHILQIDDTQGGGAVATAMAAAAKLGAAVGMAANLGDDETGYKIVASFAEGNVDTTLIRHIAGGRSSSSVVMVNPANGSRTKFPYRDNLPELEFTTELLEVISGAKLLHLDGTRYENALNGARHARSLGVTVSLDGCSMQQDNSKNLELVALSNILITNAKYPFRVTGKDTIAEALETLASYGPQVVAMTAGADGCYLWEGGAVVHIPPYPVRAVDTTGAGDVFHGAFLSLWLHNPNPIACAEFASAASALKCRNYGGRAGIPALNEVEIFRRECGR